jgi:thiol-disulfide isomerase/thioredoxin
MMDMNQIDAPLKQVKSGVLPHDVKCKEGYELIFKTSDNSPACVKPSAVPILVLRGWAIEETMMKMNDNSMSNDMMHTINATNHTMNATNHTMNATNHTMASGMNDMHTAIDESKFQKAPALVGITGYINTTPDELPQKMKGKVILYDFWTFNCINCIHTLPYVTALDAKYADKGLLIIGIHTPETFVEKDPTNVQDAVQKFGIKYPVVLDNNYETWSAFGNHYWPRQYLVDQNGYIRYNHIGEGNYDDIEKQVQMLLAENQNT